MMVPNPFIELYRDPVSILTALGYGLGLTVLLIATLAFCWSNVLTLRIQWEHQRPGQWEYDPPLPWLLRLAAVPGILAVDAWALAALLSLAA